MRCWQRIDPHEGTAAATHAVSSDGTRIAYTTTAGGGTPTLLINGWAGCAADWGSLVDRLGASGRRVVAFDPRGFGSARTCRGTARAESSPACGRSARTRWPWRAPSAPPDEAPVDVVGWSLGGLVAQELCCVAPSEVRRAVLASTSPGGDDLAELISRDFFDVFDDWSDDDTREGEAARRRAAAAAFVHASPGAGSSAMSRRSRPTSTRSSPSAAPRPRSAARRNAPWPPSRTARGSRRSGTSCSTATSTPSSTRRSRRGSPSARRAPSSLLLAGVGHRAWAQEPDEEVRARAGLPRRGLKF